MSPLPVIEGVYRVTINYSAVGGLSPVNVFHIAGTPGTVAEAEAALSLAWEPGMAAPVPEVFEPITYTILPLDGVTPGTEHIMGPTAHPFCDGGSGDYVPEAAGILKLQTDTRGPSGRGRQFIGPLSEAAIDAGVWVGAGVTNVLDAWNTFNETLQTEDFTLCVASYVHEVAHVVTNLTVNTQQATQRRRLLATR